jgi:acetolactate decarboxylase
MKTIYISTPINALVEGIYEENVSFAEIKRHGDFGLGIFNDLDGEMVMLNGTTYQINFKGQIDVVGDEALSPFACVTFFEPIFHEEIIDEIDYSAFVEMLYSLLLSPNLFYAIRVEGSFAHVKTRSFPRQESYRPLAETAKSQTTFDFNEIEGILIGFFTPSFMASLNVPGFHLHFLSSDRKHGGHLLQCRPLKCRIDIQLIDKVEISLPITLDYLTQDFTRDIEKDLNKVEK